MCYNNHKCQNGGQCVEDLPHHSFTCACPNGITGKLCEQSELTLYLLTYPLLTYCIVYK